MHAAFYPPTLSYYFVLPMSFLYECYYLVIYYFSIATCNYIHNLHVYITRRWVIRVTFQNYTL